MPRDDVAGFVSAGQDALVCIGHWHNNYAMYLHFMYLVEEAPPVENAEELVAAARPYPFRYKRPDALTVADGAALPSDKLGISGHRQLARALALTNPDLTDPCSQL